MELGGQKGYQDLGKLEEGRFWRVATVTKCDFGDRRMKRNLGTAAGHSARYSSALGCEPGAPVELGFMPRQAVVAPSKKAVSEPGLLVSTPLRGPLPHGVETSCVTIGYGRKEGGEHLRLYPKRHCNFYLILLDHLSDKSPTML